MKNTNASLNFNFLAFLSTAFMLAVPPAFAADAAPYSQEAHRKLERASRSFEPPSGATADEQVQASIQILRRLYDKAGYSFEKSLLRYVTEIERDGRPPLVREAEFIQAGYIAVLAALEHNVPLEKLFPSPSDSVLRSKLAAMAAEEKKAKQQETAQQETREREAENRDRQATERRVQEERDRRAAAAKAVEDKRLTAIDTSVQWAPVVQGRYRLRAGDDTYFDLSHVGGNVYQISGERVQQSVYKHEPATVCRLPPTEMTMRQQHERLLAGSGAAGACQLTLNLFLDGRMTLGAATPRACDALCASGQWVPLSLRSESTLRPSSGSRPKR